MFKIYSDYRFLSQVGLARIWYLNGLPFTFDEVDDPTDDVIELAHKQTYISLEEIMKASEYLVIEQCHPIIFELESVVCEEELPFWTSMKLHTPTKQFIQKDGTIWEWVETPELRTFIAEQEKRNLTARLAQR